MRSFVRKEREGGREGLSREGKANDDSLLTVGSLQPASQSFKSKLDIYT